jgi:hypothetical protein
MFPWREREKCARVSGRAKGRTSGRRKGSGRARTRTASPPYSVNFCVNARAGCRHPAHKLVNARDRLHLLLGPELRELEADPVLHPPPRRPRHPAPPNPRCRPLTSPASSTQGHGEERDWVKVNSPKAEAESGKWGREGRGEQGQERYSAKWRARACSARTVTDRWSSRKVTTASRWSSISRVCGEEAVSLGRAVTGGAQGERERRGEGGEGGGNRRGRRERRRLIGSWTRSTAGAPEAWTVAGRGAER